MEYDRNPVLPYPGLADSLSHRFVHVQPLNPFHLRVDTGDADDVRLMIENLPTLAVNSIRIPEQVRKFTFAVRSLSPAFPAPLACFFAHVLPSP